MAQSENKAVTAARMFRDGDVEGAHALAQNILRDDYDDPDALFVAATCAAKADEYGTAIHLLRRATERRPTQAEFWNNLGMAYEGVAEHNKGLAAFAKAHKLRPAESIYMANIGQSNLGMGDPRMAINWCDRAIAANPQMAGAKITRGFAYLGMGEWSKGWPGFRAGLGGKFRMQQDFGLPTWTGEKDARVIVYFEQGLGDEILHSTVINELIDGTAQVALDCDPRIVKLFRRSFPAAQCHATRRDEKHWFKEGDWTHQIAAGDLFAHFRPEYQSCTGQAFLTPSEDYRVMYQALLNKYAPGKQRVGLCWSGGNYLTNAKHRRIALDDLRPLIEAYKDTCEFFSLEYRDTAQMDIEQSGLPIHHFRHIVGAGADYEHTTAFIAELDLVFGIHTAAHHAAGATGVKSVVLVPENPSWLYGRYQGDTWCLYPHTARMVRRTAGETWKRVIERVIKDKYIAQVPQLKIAHG